MGHLQLFFNDFEHFQFAISYHSTQTLIGHFQVNGTMAHVPMPSQSLYMYCRIIYFRGFKISWISDK